MFFREHLIADQIFDDLLKQIPTEYSTGYPVYDHYAEDGNIILEFALAGYKREDINISAQENRLTISSEGAQDKGIKGRRIAKRAFRQTFINSHNSLDINNLKATFIDGILKVVIPQKPESQPRVFEIETDKKLIE